MASRRKSKGKWMQKAFGKHPGKLHRRLHVPEGEKIPASKLERAEDSSDPSLRKEAALAKVGKRTARKGGRHSHRRRSGRRA